MKGATTAVMSSSANVSNEVIQIQVGGCGNRVGSAYWSALIDEHKINRQTRKYEGNEPENDILLIGSVFAENRCGSYKPRCLAVDLKSNEEDIEEALTNNQIASFFSDKTKIALASATTSLCEPTIVNVDSLMEVLRWEMEVSDNANLFHLVHSMEGGFASKCVPLLTHELRDTYAKKSTVNSVLVTQTDDEHGKSQDYANVGHFRAIPMLDVLQKCSDGCVFYENKAIERIWRKRTRNEENLNDVDTLDLVNALVAAHMSGISSSFRLPGNRNRSLLQLMNPIVPRKGMHFFVPSLAPIFTTESCSFLRGDVNELVSQIFNENNMMIVANVNKSKKNDHSSPVVVYGAGCVFRGEMSPFRTEEQIKKRLLPNQQHLFFEGAFVNSSQEPMLAKSAAAIFTSTLITQPLKRILDSCKLDEQKLMNSRYFEGKQEDEKNEFREQINSLLEIVELFNYHAESQDDVNKSDKLPVNTNAQ